MKVDQILQTKGAEVFAVSGDAKISEAVDILHDKNIGAVVVRDGGKVAGILSERDIVRRLKREGAAVLDRRVRDCMTAEVKTCGLSATVDELMGEMTRRRIRHIPVIENGELVGLVSIGDVVKRKIEEAEQEAQALKEYIAS
ncbi:MAG: CBS domain-containing protein [Alphaproteobacteria bacterium]|nr:CBS domain-containing protein [Alphaproteobacteria bacterium]